MIYVTPLLFLRLWSPPVAVCYWLCPWLLPTGWTSSRPLSAPLWFPVNNLQVSFQHTKDLPFFSPKDLSSTPHPHPPFLHSHHPEPYYLSGKWLRWQGRLVLVAGWSKAGVHSKYQAFSASTSEFSQNLGTSLCLLFSSGAWLSARVAVHFLQCLFWLLKEVIAHKHLQNQVF